MLDVQNIYSNRMRGLRALPGPSALAMRRASGSRIPEEASARGLHSSLSIDDLPAALGYHGAPPIAHPEREPASLWTDRNRPGGELRPRGAKHLPHGRAELDSSRDFEREPDEEPESSPENKAFITVRLYSYTRIVVLHSYSKSCPRDYSTYSEFVLKNLIIFSRMDVGTGADPEAHSA